MKDSKAKILLFLAICLILIFKSAFKNKNTEQGFFFTGEDAIEYEAIILPLLNDKEIYELWNNVTLRIRLVEKFDTGILYALELDQIQIEGIGDVIRSGRRYLGYFYVQDDVIYLRRLWGFEEGRFNDRQEQEIVDLLREDEEEFLEGCLLVCCEEGTEDIVDEEQWHKYVEVSGDTRIFRMYSDYRGGTKEYLKIVWERGKGITYYCNGTGNGFMQVEFGVDLYRYGYDFIPSVIPFGIDLPKEQ